MFGIGSNELLIILVFAFLLFGPDKLPGMGRTIGRALRQFREAQEGFTSVVQSEVVDPLTEAINDPDAAKKKREAAKAGAEEDADLEEAPHVAEHEETFAERRARLKKEKEEREAAEAAAAEPADGEGAPAPAPEASVPAADDDSDLDAESDADSDADGGAGARERFCGRDRRDARGSALPGRAADPSAPSRLLRRLRPAGYRPRCVCARAEGDRGLRAPSGGVRLSR